SCIFGNGCPGIYADSVNVGCCSLGAHFTEPADDGVAVDATTFEGPAAGDA
ncbi:hypothetical protein GTR02_20735, partial [Kineococcus sp. R8]|nr:hypothetical protein [Kineococcus siccus]